jgi:hypothetical protein
VQEVDPSIVQRPTPVDPVRQGILVAQTSSSIERPPAEDVCALPMLAEAANIDSTLAHRSTDFRNLLNPQSEIHRDG